MTPAVLYGLSGALLVAIGLAGAIASLSLVRRILGFNVLGSGAFVIIIAFARRVAGPLSDPVRHTLVLTPIDVTVSANPPGGGAVGVDPSRPYRWSPEID